MKIDGKICVKIVTNKEIYLIIDIEKASVIFHFQFGHDFFFFTGERKDVYLLAQ